MEEEETRAGTVVVTSRGLAGWLVPDERGFVVAVPSRDGCQYYELDEAWQIAATPPETARAYIALMRRWWLRPYLRAGQMVTALVLALALALDALARWGG